MSLTKQHKVKKSTLRNKADKLMSLYVRKLGYCQIRGLDTIRCSDQLNDMHIRTRGVTALRYDLINHLCGCSGHHVFYTNNPSKWDALIQKYFPERWAHIQAHQNDKVKKTEDLYRQVIEQFKEEV